MGETVTRRVIFRKSDGTYLGNSESLPPGASLADLYAYAVGCWGGKPDDYVIRETDDVAPWLCHFVNGELVPDPVKVAAALDAETAEEDRVADRQVLRAKLAERTATLKDVCEWLVPLEE